MSVFDRKQQAEKRRKPVYRPWNRDRLFDSFESFRSNPYGRMCKDHYELIYRWKAGKKRNTNTEALVCFEGFKDECFDYCRHLMKRTLKPLPGNSRLFVNPKGEPYRVDKRNE